jgi:plastocyanin
MRHNLLGLGWGKRARALALAGALARIATACSEGDAKEPAPVQERSEVQIATFVFEPKVLQIGSGTTVRWTNGDEILHTATSGEQVRQGIPGVEEDKAARPDGIFDLEMDGRGFSASFTFEEPGTYEYFCRVHAAMTGRVVVS